MKKAIISAMVFLFVCVVAQTFAQDVPEDVPEDVFMGSVGVTGKVRGSLSQNVSFSGERQYRLQLYVIHSDTQIASQVGLGSELEIASEPTEDHPLARQFIVEKVSQTSIGEKSEAAGVKIDTSTIQMSTINGNETYAVNAPYGEGQFEFGYARAELEGRPEEDEYHFKADGVFIDIDAHVDWQWTN